MARSLPATLILLLLVSAPYCYATPAAAPAKQAKTTWQQLTAQQRPVLAPVAAKWDQMPERQRKKLIVVANTYPKMKPQEQARITARLTEWAKLSPQERDLARARYKQIKKLPPEKHKEVRKKWEQYRAEQKPSSQALQPADQPQPYITEDESPSSH
jgi:Protein of unknown function (DUF3106)